MHDDVYQMYLDEIAAIRPMDAAEEAQLLEKLRDGRYHGTVPPVEGLPALYC